MQTMGRVKENPDVLEAIYNGRGVGNENAGWQDHPNTLTVEKVMIQNAIAIKASPNTKRICLKSEDYPKQGKWLIPLDDLGEVRLTFAMTVQRCDGGPRIFPGSSSRASRLSGFQ